MDRWNVKLKSFVLHNQLFNIDQRPNLQIEMIKLLLKDMKNSNILV